MEIKAIHIIGAGSLGSFATLLIAKEIPVLDCPVNVYDFDKVEERNTGNQLYRLNDVSRLKIESLKDMVEQINDQTINCHNLKIEEGTNLRGIPVVLIDNMQGRKNIFLSCCYNASIPYYIEARTGNNMARVYAFNPRCKDWVDRYERTLYSDDEVPDRACADRETVPSLWAVASVIAEILIRRKKEKIFYNEFLEINIDYGQWPLMTTDIVEEL